MSASTSHASPEAAGAYSYKPLGGQTDIRLLFLFAGAYEDRLVCHLATYPLAKSLSFDALSYVWGQAEERTQISCNGKDLYITSNLDRALRQIRSLNRPRCIWADQICINQQDPHERGHQVLLMGSIYSRARKVVACFGGTRDEGRGFSTFMDELTLYMEKAVEQKGDWNEVHYRQHPDSFLEASGFRTLLNIFQHAYFTRVWVIQELGFANLPVVLVGDSEISWATLLECSLFLRRDVRLLNQKPTIGGGKLHHLTITDWRPNKKRHWFIREARNRSFVTLLDQTRHLEASDERDRIFAFLGHPTASMPDGSTIVSPDYTTDLNSCLYHFAKQWIMKSGDLTILGAVDIHRPKKYRNLPSWVPAWQKQKRNYNSLYAREDNLYYGAGALSYGLCEVNGRFLTVRGVKLDSVSVLCPLNVHPDETSDPSAFRSIRRAWAVVESQSPLFTRGAPRHFTFIQTLSATALPLDYFSEHQLASETSFLDYLQHQEMTDLKPDEESMRQALTVLIRGHTYGRQLMISRNHGIMGLVPETTVEGDVCCIVAQCQVPLIIRRTFYGTGQYSIVGEAYLHGYMRGEVANDVKAGHAQVTELTLR